VSLHDILQEITGHVIDSEKAQWEACFKESALPEPGKRKVVFVEADGSWVHLQREKQGHYELKNAIVYEGWERIGDERYELVNVFIAILTKASPSGKA
jgi:hypothetical protein